MQGDTGTSPGDCFLPERAWASQFPSHDFSHQGKAHSWGRQAPQISEAAQAGTWPRAEQACDREPIQVPVLPEVGESGTLFSDIFRSTHRVGCSGPWDAMCLMSVRLCGQAPASPTPPSVECSAHLAENSSFFGLGILESRSQRSATMGAYSLQHRDDGEKGGPLEASDESVISGVGGSVCRKPGQQPCLGRGSTAPSQLSTRSPPALGTLQNQSLANLTRAHSLQHSPPGPWNTISVPTAGLSLACRQDFLPSTSRGKSSQETPHLTRHTIHPLTSS